MIRQHRTITYFNLLDEEKYLAYNQKMIRNFLCIQALWSPKRGCPLHILFRFLCAIFSCPGARVAVTSILYLLTLHFVYFWECFVCALPLWESSVLCYYYYYYYYWYNIWTKSVEVRTAPPPPPRRPPPPHTHTHPHTHSFTSPRHTR